MAYTTIDDPTAFFQCKLYTGTGSSHAISLDGPTDMQPDMVWWKERTSTDYHTIVDSVRGATKRIFANVDEAADTNAESLKSFQSNGFTMGTNTGANDDNQTYVAWNWKAGTSFTNDASSTSVGSIDSAGSASDISGFSIVSFTGTGSNGTIKHGLSTAPNLFIIKRLDADNDFRVGSSVLTNFVKHINLNTDAAESNLAVAFNSTGPTTSVFSVGTSISVNADAGTYIAYCFSSIKGYSKIGSYTGNGNADGTFVYTGFKPAFVITKRITDGNESWHIFDNKRNPFNIVNKRLQANSNGAEDTAAPLGDFTAGGFKIRGTGGGINVSGKNFIYMAFAENPFVTSTGVPATAR